MRVIVRKERPHPGAQLRFTDIDGHRFTCFATDTRRGQLADLELRHRRRARCEDRIRCAKDTGLRNLPLKGFAQNQIWCEIVALACELLAWTQMLALAGAARRWEPKRLRLRLFCRRRPPGRQRPPPAAPPRRTLALGRRYHRRGRPPAGPPVWLTSRNSAYARKEKTPGPWNPRSPAHAVYPGTFTPVTPGHLDIIERARHLFGRVTVLVAVNADKQPASTPSERAIQLRRELPADWDNVLGHRVGRADRRVLPSAWRRRDHPRCPQPIRPAS